MAGERKWTENQRAAIEARERTLLLSAGAGAGKTATLIERIMCQLTDPAHPGDVSRMLVVTFTRAAAAELRARLATALQAALAEGGPSAHLSEQLLLLPGARISTIDSFAIELVRSHAVRLGLSPAFRLADAAEVKLLKESVLTRLLDDCYEGEVPVDAEEFLALMESFSERGKHPFGELFLSLYDSLRNYAASCHLLRTAAEELARVDTAAPFHSRYGKYLQKKALEEIDRYLAAYDLYCEELALDEGTALAYLPVFRAEANEIRALRRAILSDKYTEARERVFAFEKQRLGALRGEAGKTDQAVAAKDMRDRWHKSALPTLRRSFFAYTEEQWKGAIPPLARAVSLLADLVERFDSRLSAEKQRRNLAEFTDVSHYALHLLYEADMQTKTPLAAEVMQDFDEVYIDEYQDVNEVQHLLFDAIARPRHRFMVGDVKQSIYGFRGAQPEIFAALRRAYIPLDEAHDFEECALLSLSENFRSAKPILDFVNLVFGRLMEGAGDSIGYIYEDRLLAGGDHPTDLPDVPPVQLAIFGRGKRKKLADEEPDSEDEEEVRGELAYVVREIRRLICEGRRPDGSSIYPGDIAILGRNAKILSRFAAALTENGLQVLEPKKKGFFDNAEVELALSLLNVVDNPRRDIHLAAVLRSPLYGFSMDELIAVRRESESTAEGRGESFYEALCRFVTVHPDFEKGRLFLSDLADFRRQAEGLSVDRLIWLLYHKTGLLSLAGAGQEGDGTPRRANLMLLYNYARRFEGTSYSGLYSFIDYVNGVIERGGEGLEEEPAGEDRERRDAVRLMTVHHSKGLEYPVVFLVGCGSPLRAGEDKPLLFDRELGCAIKLRDESGLAFLRNPFHNALQKKIASREIEEEMRVLYVALTRPRERLYVTGTVSSPETAVLAHRFLPARLTAGDAYACRNYLEMVLCAVAGKKAPFFELYCEGEDLLPPSEDTRVSPNEEERRDEAGAQEICPDGTPAVPTALLDELTSRFDYLYPHRYVCDLPTKLSVSALYPTLLDSEEEAAPTEELGAHNELLKTGANGTPVLPNIEDMPAAERAALAEFLGDEGTAQDTPTRHADRPPRFLGGEVSAAERAAHAGTATHLFLQFCDFENLQKAGAEAELARLRACRFISDEDAALVRLDEIEVFARSPLAAKMLAGGKLWRELRFHIRLPAATLTADPERRAAYADEHVLVQGVIDCLLETVDGELWLLDYKTDRLTRAEKADRTQAETRLISRHALQLSYYALAVRDIFGRLPDRVMIYSLALGDTVEVPFSDGQVKG